MRKPTGYLKTTREDKFRLRLLAISLIDQDGHLLHRLQPIIYPRTGPYGAPIDAPFYETLGKIQATRLYTTTTWHPR